MTASIRQIEPIPARDFVRAIGAGFADGVAGRAPEPQGRHPVSYAEGYAVGERFAPRSELRQSETEPSCISA